MKSKFTPEQFAEVVARKKAGETTPKLAAEYGIARNNLWRLLKRYDKGLLIGHSWNQTLKTPFPIHTAAYIAGLYDGEGSLSWTSRKTWVLRIASTCEEVIRYLEGFCGTVSDTAHIDPRPNRKPVWHWSVARQRDVRALLHEIRPYLIIRGARADECLFDLDKRMS